MVCAGRGGGDGRGPCFSVVHVALNHKASAGGHLKVSFFKERTLLAADRHNKRVKPEVPSPASK